MKRITLTLLAAALPLAPKFALAQQVNMQVQTPVMQMPVGHLPHSPIPTPVPLPNIIPGRHFPIPTLPGPLPVKPEFLPNFGTVIPGVHLPTAGVPVRLNLFGGKTAKATPVAASLNSRAENFQKTLAVLRENFGLNEDGGLRDGVKAEEIAGAFEGRRGRTTIPEQDLERDLGVK
ncbi:MAG: hypothetical protein HY925_14085 [Elusimicrobia bacterium]|nr:hypothetical protein [Elusimicrobiota bacterium]